MSITLLLLLIPMGLVVLAQMALSATYKKYSKIPNSRGLTGEQVARAILDRNGLHDVQIYKGHGQLSDYFDPKNNLIKLSPDVYSGSSIASLAVAAHEVGHAIQYATKYSIIGFRNLVLPMAIGAGNVAWIVIIAAFIFGQTQLLWLGVGLMVVIAIFQLLTLPLEFNASSRALRILEDENFLTYEEVPQARKVLNSAAMTYVVALIVTLAEIARLIIISMMND